ncbi:alpha-2-macroglobulin-like protein 1 [Apteryx mantelli]|uniref:Alpha-2-macroglobulin-like protein 1 n=1 Tax=Apteryx mantelli TaxID=2696672 RepID=A0ABM4FSI3_9AVES
MKQPFPRRYVVLFPSVLYYPYVGKVHVHLMDMNESVRVTLQLVTSHNNSSIILEEKGTKILHLNWPQLSNISALSPGEEEVAHLHILIQGGSLRVSEHRKVLVKALELVTLVQTDKAVYKPGQTVKFRIVRLDKDFIPSNSKLPLVAVQDPRGNGVAQWQDVSPRQGIVELSLPLSAEPALGTYTIKVGGKRHSFRVQDYGLPHFEVVIQLPRFVMELDKRLQLQVCGRYPSRKPFRGRAEGSLCQYYQPYWSSVGSIKNCVEFMGQTGKNGCFSTEVLMASFNLTSFDYERRLYAHASLLEEGTGMWREVTKSCEILPDVFTVTFENTDDIYRPGIPYTGTMLLTGADGSPLKEKQLLLIVASGGNNTRQIFLTDESGRASFELDTSGWTESVSLSVSDPCLSSSGALPCILWLNGAAQVNETDHDQEYDGSKLRHQSAFLSLRPFYSESQSFLQIHRLEEELPCNQPHQLQVDYILAREALGTELQSVHVVFLVMAKGTIAMLLRKELHLPGEDGLRGSFSLELPVGLELAPTAKVLCYAVLPNGEMIADSTELHVAKCFPNKVKLDFSKKRALAGSKLHLKVQAVAGSLCAVHAVDQSMQSFSPKAELTPSMHAALKIVTNTKIRKPCTEDIPLRSRRSLAIPPNPQAVPTSTGARVKQEPKQDGVLAPGPKQDPAPQRDFLGTWLWDLVPVGEGGSAEVPVMVPDTITKWKAGMFCTAGLGFGLSPTITLTAFKPFFVELALPYAVIRDEAFTLKATVFNYLQQCLRVRVTLAESMQLEVSASAEGTYSGCVCADEARTFQWGVRATSLGEVNVTVSAEALHSKELCGSDVPVVPTHGHVYTEKKLLLVQPPRPM